MNYIASPWAIVIFLIFVSIVLWISFHFARLTKSAASFYAAGGTIPWGVNGIAFAGDYLSAASFLGICGMIAFSGYDGFLYSIGYLAGWIVALFVVAEPMKRLGKYTFTDALDSKFNSKGIQITAAISTLLVSLFYLIPQMVGAGSLVTPLLGLPHWVGVVMVGSIVIIIVTMAGMTSTTYVQFIKGALLIMFSLALVFLVFSRGISTNPDQGGDVPYHQFITLKVTGVSDEKVSLEDASYKVTREWKVEKGNNVLRFVQLQKDGVVSIWKFNDKLAVLEETQHVTLLPNGSQLFNGEVKKSGKFYAVGHMSEVKGRGPEQRTGTLDFFSFIKKIKEGTVVRWNKETVLDNGSKVTIYYQNPTPGKDILKPGLKFKVDSAKGATNKDKWDFISLMLALFFGTAALPHILIRYYTVPSPACARKSTIVAIACIGLFYVLTLYMGLGAQVNGVLDLTNDNMSAPLLAKSFGVVIFACISALAFATVLGTVSGLIIAASGAVAHDVMDRFMGKKLSDHRKVSAGKMAAVAVGCIAMILGVLFKGMNVSYLVGWAFAIAASANLPSILMLLFWKKTTASGIVASISVGLVSSLGMILLSQETYNNVYHLVGVTAPIQLNNPAIITVPLSFLALIAVSYFTQPKDEKKIHVDPKSV
jgi:cation/acetate symporter